METATTTAPPGTAPPEKEPPRAGGAKGGSLKTSADRLAHVSCNASTCQPDNPARRSTIRVWSAGVYWQHARGGAYAYSCAHNGQRHERSGFLEATTAERIELVGLIAALESLPVPATVELNTDSRALLAILRRLRAKPDWSGRNADLVAPLRVLLQRHNVVPMLIRNPSESLNAIRVDWLAHQAVRASLRARHTEACA